MENLFKIKSPVTSTISIKSSNEPESKSYFEQVETNQLFSQKPKSVTISKSNITTLLDESFKNRHTQELKNISKNEEDILASLIDKSDIVDKSRRTSLEENLFDNKSYLSNNMDSMTSKNIKKAESDIILSNTIQESKADTIEPTVKLTTRESRRGRRTTKIINDPLGLLSGDLVTEQNLELKTLEKDLPEWLGGSKKSEAKNEEVPKTNKISASKQNVKIHDIDSAIDTRITGTSDLEGASIFPEHFSLLHSTQLNQQSALMNMQQQEHELRTAAIVSQQNEQLSKISNAQHSMLHNQEEQFNSLLKLQFERQAVLEKQIKLQQERINQYIQVLMTQPVPISSTTSVYTSCKSNSDEKENGFANEKKEMENIIKNLEKENSILQIKLSTINEKHNNEIIFQAEFYERQISFLKEAIIKSEEKVKQEIECLETDYVTKYEKLKDEKLQAESQYKEEIHNLKNEHAQHVEELCKLHSENVKLLEKEYSIIIGSISTAKQTEDQIVKAMTSQKTDIEDILQRAAVIIEGMVENKKKLENKHDKITEFQKDTLKIYEDNIKAQKLELKNQKSILEDYSNKFMETTDKLNTRFTQLITELQKQNTFCNQAQEILDKNTTNLLREKELFEEKMKWEREYMQTLKEFWMKEKENQQKLLAEEKEAIAAEKAQLEVLNKLKSNSNEIAKVELEAAIKTAQEVTAAANLEKLEWQKRNDEFNLHKQVLIDKENSLILRAKELENLTQSALIKKEEGIRALKNAKHLENQNKEKFNELQLQIQALIEREKKVANEKYNITKDKMVSLAYKIEKPEKDVNVSANFQNDIISFSEAQSKSEITTELMSMIDPNLFMLKLNLNNEFDSIDKYI
ncbi:unnamed protein product [Xylocopa violacea]|uniref:Fas-binding factor 1 C-terminal domain-containing protein n=1 Tax=Xylocopa violacea TaxID=135666 RepID=A0ABP1P1R3_XYLVO